jgi:hypothetical protein
VSRQTNDPRPPDHTDAARDVARGLSEAASHLAGLKSEAMSWLGDPYSALRLRLESAHAAVEAAMVEARRRVRLNEGNRHR